MASNRSKRPRLGLGLPIGPFGTCATLGLNLYMLPHEVVRRLHLRPLQYYFGITWCITCKDRLVTPSQLKPTPILCTLAPCVSEQVTHTSSWYVISIQYQSSGEREIEWGRERGREEWVREGEVSEGGREGRREGEREGVKEGGRGGVREGGREVCAWGRLCQSQIYSTQNIFNQNLSEPKKG